MGKRNNNRSRNGSSQRNNSNNNNNRNNNYNFQQKFVDHSLSDCKPTTPGATDVIFSGTGPGNAGVDSFLFNERIQTLARNIPALYKYGGPTIANVLENLTEPTFDDLPDLGADATERQKKKRDMKNEMIWKEESYYKSNNQTLYYRLLTHCTKVFQGQLEKRSEFKAIKDAMNGVLLAKLIQRVYLSDGDEDEEEDELQGCAKGAVTLYSTPQRRDESNSDFVRSIAVWVEVIEAMGMQVGFFSKVLKNRLIKRMLEAKISIKTTDADEKKKMEEIKNQELEAIQEQHLVYVAFELLDKSRFAGLQKSMRAGKLTSVTKWPKTKAELIGLLDDWEILHPRDRKQQQPPPRQPPPS